MSNRIKKIFSVFLSAIICLSTVTLAMAEDKTPPFDVNAKSAVLMDAETGTILYNKNGDEALPPASVTKVMTLLLVMEAIDNGSFKLTDPVTVSDYAASMGGSQVFLEPGEEMCVEEMLKCVIIASANDAAVALAEKTAGSVDEFVRRMNERAAELGMKNTHFENPTGLDDNVTNHTISARDIAIMSRELIRHETILKYSCIWMDTIRNGEFGLTNTNRLIRFYNGATGLKTGSTSKAGFCISATAKRDGMHLIAVIMGSPTRDERNSAAKSLLDYGFAKYCVYTADGGNAGKVKVIGGTKDAVQAKYEGLTKLLPAGKKDSVKIEIKLDDKISAPVKEGQRVGAVRYLLDGEVIGEIPATAAESVPRIGYFRLLYRMLCRFILA
ncbi:MAG: D-alanyl-D-alanine carboxypeptidase [Ruminococcaceae bacterium]|nr:D-alanyl-D-alanine carboxypeptidase [Oscillospiraceae bacterium]